jgi:hypothetical protein
MHNRKLAKNLGVTALFVVLVGIVGTMDYEDAIAEADLYCQNVHAGVWPDYEGTYAKECRDGHYEADR